MSRVRGPHARFCEKDKGPVKLGPCLTRWGEHVLLAGGYGDEHSLASLVVLKDGKTIRVADFDLGLPADVRCCLTGRGHLLHYVTSQEWWTLDMRDLL